MNDPAYSRELAVEQRVRVEIGRRLEFPVDQAALQVRNNHILRAQLVVVDARGLNNDQALFAVDASV